jgi:hypothetical protein
MLCAHPQIYICHESWFYFWNNLLPKKYTGSDFLRYYAGTYTFRWLKLDPSEIEEMKAEFPATLLRDEIGPVFREIMKRKAAQYGRVRYGDKSPHPRTTMISISRLHMGSPTDLPNCLGFEAMRKAVLPYLDRLHQVRLEDLLSDTEPVMRRILDFVEEPWDDAVLDHSNHLPDYNDMPPVPWLSQAAEPRGASQFNWNSIPPSRLKVIEYLCRKSMQLYGYEPAPVDGPGMLRTRLDILTQVPSMIVYYIKLLRLLGYMKDPENWAGNDKTRSFRQSINPNFEKYYPNFQWPRLPDEAEPETEATTASTEGARST